MVSSPFPSTECPAPNLPLCTMAHQAGAHRAQLPQLSMEVPGPGCVFSFPSWLLWVAEQGSGAAPQGLGHPMVLGKGTGLMEGPTGRGKERAAAWTPPEPQTLPGCRAGQGRLLLHASYLGASPRSASSRVSALRQGSLLNCLKPSKGTASKSQLVLRAKSYRAGYRPLAAGAGAGRCPPSSAAPS